MQPAEGLALRGLVERSCRCSRRRLSTARRRVHGVHCRRFTHTIPQILRFFCCTPQHLVASHLLPYMGCHLMRAERNPSMTRCEIAKLTPVCRSQLLDITGEKKKAREADRFCLTGPAPRSYFAGSPQAVVVARRLPAQPIVGRLWTVGVRLGMRGEFDLDGELRLVGGKLWHWIREE